MSRTDAREARPASGDGPADCRGCWDLAIALTGAALVWLALALVWPAWVLEPAASAGPGPAARPPWHLLAPAMLAELFPAGWVGLALLAAALAGLPLLGAGQQPLRPGLRHGLILAGCGLALLLGLAGWWRAW
ncbi:MAG: hypothetical protein V1797_11685 [Pseudomonadota bacterium]